MAYRDTSYHFLSLLFYAVVLFLSYILHRPIAGHTLTIKRIAIIDLSLHDIYYSGRLFGESYAFTFTCSRMSIQFHLPRPSNPCFCTFTADTLLYVSTTCDISVETLVTLLWLLPVLFRKTAGPWMDVTLDGFRIRVDRSRETPYYIQQLRHNLVGTIMSGDILRLDTSKLDVRTLGLSEIEHAYADGNCNGSSYCFSKPSGSEACAEPDSIAKPLGTRQQKIPFQPGDKDEVRITASVRELHVHNREGRLYTLGNIDAQLRRNWDADQGSFTIVAEHTKWHKIPWPFEHSTPSEHWSCVSSYHGIEGFRSQFNEGFSY